MANVISDKKAAVITVLLEGCSVRNTSRMTGVSKGAALRLLVSVGTACAKYQGRVIRNTAARRVLVDEIWSFVDCKQKKRYRRENGCRPLRKCLDVHGD